ncbi:MAG: beta-lactamase family protein [Gemmatimonadales bacterium]|nr:beta-lactamase family protein [Gemmatimonadales bacterium]
MRLRLFLLFLAVVAVAPGAAAQGTDRFAPVRATIKRILDSTGTPSIAVAVSKDGKVIWEEGFGWANREKRIPATQHTMYSLASISKPITATALMVLVDRGIVALDKPANDYLGVGKITSLAGDASGATVARVLSHTAGLPLHYRFFYNNLPYGAPSMDEAIGRYGSTVFPPGQIYEYSNLGYGIIDHIVERMGGQTYADFMRNEVFLPLGLTHTTIDIGPGLEEYAAERYDGRGRPVPFYAFDHAGASAVYSSAHDLVRFGMFHLKNKLPGQRQILKPETIDLMQRPIAPANYGLGWNTSSDRGHRRFSHTGGMPGVSTVLHMYPDQNVTITVLTNAGPSGLIAQEIAAVMLPGYADSLKAQRAQATQPPRRDFTPSSDLVGEWTGTLRTWQRTVPLRLLIKPDGDVHVWLASQPRAILNNVWFNNGRLSGRFAGTIPTDDAQLWRHDVLLGLLHGNGTLRGQASAMSTDELNMGSIASYVDLRKN